MPCRAAQEQVWESDALEKLGWRAAKKSKTLVFEAIGLIWVAMKSAAKSLAKAKASTTAPAALPASTRRSILKFNADIPVYASSTLGSSSTGAFVVGGGGGRARTGVKNGLHVLAPPFETPKRAGEGKSLPFINLENLRVLSLCSCNGQSYATTVESIVAFGSADSRMNETSRLCLKFAKSSASIANYDAASANLKDSVSKGATAEDLLVFSRAVDKSLDELDSQNVVTFVHREALYVMSPTGIWRIKDDGRRLVPEALKPLSWDGHKHGWIKLALSLNKDQFLCLCIAAASTGSGSGGNASSRQQLLVLDAKDGRVAWTVPFAPLKSFRINHACVLRDHIYFVTASTKKNSEGALWRCAFKSPSNVPEQVSEFKAPAVCLAACPARETIVVGTADGSLHLIRPNSWRRYVRQIQAHKLATTCVSVSGGMICSASIDKTISVVSIDYEVWFSKMMLLLWALAALVFVFIMRGFELI